MKFHKFFSASTLFFFAFFIIIGNLLRLIDFGFYHSILVTEFVLYFISIFCVYTLRNSFRFAATISLFILSSSIFGALYNGFYFPSILYAVRLVGMILSGIVIGKLIFNKY